MNFHVAGLTPTQRAAVARHQSFKASIEARAVALAQRKENAAFEALCVVAREAPLSQTPSIKSVEAMPADAEPSSNWFVMLATEPKRSDYPSIRDIQKAVCKHYDVNLVDMLSSRRTAKVVRPRQVAYYLAKKLTLHSLPQIGRRFGGRDHTTALSGIKKITRLRETDESLDAVLNELASKLGATIA